MRAERLLGLMMVLQSGSRSTAAALGRRLGVSERTIHRDVAALSAMGVPVHAARGPEGGVSLLEGWRSRLTGLTRAEVHALAALGAPGALADLGLSAPLQTGLVKLTAALPAMQQPVVEYARQRLHVDASGWFDGRERVPHLELLREAAWQNRPVRLSYRNVEARPSTRVVEPLGLVLKADRWYLVAAEGGAPRVFRGARVSAVRLRPGTFTRPPSFDLPAFWAEWCARFAEARPRYEVELRLTRAGAAALVALRPPGDRVLLARARRARDGTKVATIDFEREGIALSQLCSIGAGVEVLSPAPLRQRLRTLGAALRATYGA